MSVAGIGLTMTRFGVQRSGKCAKGDCGIDPAL